MYAQRKVASQKEVRTADASARALQNVSQQAQRNLDSHKLRRGLLKVRKVHWFEKFNWCVTSEGYLVLSGRDAMQSEAIFQRHLRPGDAYVTADIKGAGVGVGYRPISPIALQEAGALAVCRSSAWTGKILGQAAWWVWAEQVGKITPNGPITQAGLFCIRGKKNFLPPMQLEMGFGVMFRLEEGSVERHGKDWKDRSFLDDCEVMSAFSEAMDRYDVTFDHMAEEEEWDRDGDGEGDGERE
ncbi:hypothetical protein B484DRAFT_345570, partial [Ochromonadaceae sp. CCMP2298]